MGEPQRKAAIIEPNEGAYLAWLGATIRYLAVGEQTAGRYALSVNTLPAGGIAPSVVRHREHVGFYVLSGALTASVGNRTLSLPAGGFLGIAPGTAHRLANPSPTPTEVLVAVGPAGFDEFQFRAGFPLSGSGETASPPTAADQEVLATLAPGYGVELDPSESAFSIPPRIRLTLPGEGKAFAVARSIYRFLTVSEDTEGRYSAWHVTVPPGGGPPSHSHTHEDEAFYVVAGTATFRIEGGTRPLGPGGSVHLPSGTRHRFTNDTTEPVEMLILTAPAGLERLIETVGRVWPDAGSLPGPPDTVEIGKLREAAPKYGIVIDR